ncbi:helix-turn-helix transcriptional regulator, partial [Bacteroides uniformis]|uniref:helix-turn-helix transcriptional regulator n=1 Tax=Bacteroides uniformis TaxID=820 RepID=UPI0039B570D7
QCYFKVRRAGRTPYLYSSREFTEHLRLTATDLRFCALLRLNLSTKDIAQMTNLTIRGVEAARYRLRKKLDIPDGTGLVDFLIDLK